MLSMKKFAKCSAATMISASGRASASAAPIALNSAWKASLSAGSAKCARPVIPGAWLQAPAKTRLIARLSSGRAGDERSYAGDLLVRRGRHRVDARPHRPVTAHAFAHRLDVVGPGHAEQRGEVHQQLAVGAQLVE